MNVRQMLQGLLVVICLFGFSSQTARAQEKMAPGAVQVHLVITDLAVRAEGELPRLKHDEVKVRQGKTNLQVTQLIPAQGEDAALQLMILIDDTLNTQAVGNNLNDLREFIKAQPRPR